jgi:hypothetical protein
VLAGENTLKRVGAQRQQLKTKGRPWNNVSVQGRHRKAGSSEIQLFPACGADPQGSHRQVPALLSGIRGPTRCIPSGFRIRKFKHAPSLGPADAEGWLLHQRAGLGVRATPPHPWGASFRCPHVQGCGNAKRTCNAVRERRWCPWADQTS